MDKHKRNKKENRTNRNFSREGINTPKQVCTRNSVILARKVSNMNETTITKKNIS